ncbi:hypothetical protein [Thioalkalivibrio sp.]|uniref:hypothetical protein n=1 Tax=Thioalkalivibrio sp. TaxID=2093813 RepID=UPI0012D6AB3D|nr:hypothetical protein [Thioalkalivibrio sp.]TVP84000.1 MAG: hypothetical protein EA346_00100 [Thioalkalivibrio sp.]
MSETTDHDDRGTMKFQLRAMETLIEEGKAKDRWNVIFDHSEPDDDTWIVAISYRDRSPDGLYDRTEIRVHSSTHWSIPMILVIDRGYRSHGQPQISWSSGGVCTDASELQVARAMRVIWGWAEGFLARQAISAAAGVPVEDDKGMQS